MPLHLRSFLLAQRKRLIIFVIYAIIITALALGRGRAYGDLIQSLIEAKNSSRSQIFLFAMLAIVGIELLLFALRIPYDFLYSRCRGYMNIHARVFGVDRIISQHYSKLAQMGSGKLLQIVHNGMEGYSYLIYDGLRVGIDMLISLVVLMVTIGLGNAWFLVYFVVGAGSLYVFQRFAFGRLTDVRLRERDLNESYTKQTAKMLMNFLLITIYGIKEQELATLRSIGQARVDNYARLKLWFNGVASAGNLLLIGLMLGTTFVFGMEYLAGTMDLSYIMTIFFLTNFARERFYGFGLFLAELAEKITYIHRYDEMTTVTEEEKKETLTKIDRFAHDIVFDRIRFGYDEKIMLFDDFSLTIPWGQKIAIMGSSGSGKSTLCKLLTRLSIEQGGEIRFVPWRHIPVVRPDPLRCGENDIRRDGSINRPVPITNLPIADLYRHIGYLYQEPLVFDGTIRDNLSLHTPVSDDILQSALVKAWLDVTLTLDTVVGEHGLLLSWGEKQRVALARAFVFDYDVLILDEPTSNLDAELEQKLLTSLFAAYKDKTIICITHRPFVLDMVERVVTIKNGVIVGDEIQTNDL